MGKRVNHLDKYAFSKCSSLTSFTIPSAVTCIEEGLLWDTPKLTNVTMHNRIYGIGKYAFKQSGITQITIPESVNKIQEEAFSGCRLIQVNYGGSKVKWKDLDGRWWVPESAKIMYEKGSGGFIQYLFN